jgi:hypothetical protein
MIGNALTASELSKVAGVTAQTASAHLKKLQTGGLIQHRKSGRFHYFEITDEDVARLLATMSVLANKKGYISIRTGPKDPALRKARVCYNHLAGEMGVHIYDVFSTRASLTLDHDELTLTPKGWSFIDRFGINIAALTKERRPTCKACLDWSVRRSHLAGGLGPALLSRILDLGWAKREPNSRIIRFSTAGEASFRKQFVL